MAQRKITHQATIINVDIFPPPSQGIFSGVLYGFYDANLYIYAYIEEQHRGSIMRLIYIGAAWSAGIILAEDFTTLSTIIWLIGCIAAAIVLRLVWESPETRILGVVAAAFVLGGLRYSFVPQTSDIAQYNRTGGLTIEGMVIGDPDIRDDRTLLRVRAERIIRGGDEQTTSGLVLVRVPRLTEVTYGDHIQATGRLNTPGAFDNFSYADYLGRRGVFSIMDNTSLEVISSGHGSSVYAALYALRRDVRDIIAQHLPEPQAGLLTGILTGNERGLSPALDADFQATGASHIIAISGFNMVIIAGIVMQFMAYATERPGVRVIVALGVLIVYTVFTGANAAVIRAALMSGVLIIGQNIGRKTYVPTSLAFVALLMTIITPNTLWDVSFQLSFFATLGLALFADPLQQRFNALLSRLFPRSTARTISGFLSEPLVVTIAAQITTLPLTVFYFSRLSSVALLVNLLIVPVQAYLLIVGGLAVIIAFASPMLAQVLFWVDMTLLSWTISIVRRFADLSFAERDFFINADWVYGYLGFIGLWATLHAAQPGWWFNLSKLIRSRFIISSTLFAGFAVILLMIGIFRSRPDGHLHIHFLDVGHSNGVFIITPGGAQILVDGGRFPSRLLTQLGDHIPFNDREIELLVITQPDEFDTSALTAVLDRYEVAAVLTNGQPNLSRVNQKLNTQLEGRDVLAVTAGYTVNLSDGTRLEVLHPQTTPRITDDLNDVSLVLRLSYGDVSVLITGDLSADAQVQLLDGGYWPGASVLQLPQHGAARSIDQAFLEEVQAQTIIIQADEANTRGDPDPDILATLPDVPLFRTDEGGSIHLWTDGSRLWVQQEN